MPRPIASSSHATRTSSSMQFAEEMEAEARCTPWSPGQSSVVPRFGEYASRFFAARIVSPGTKHKERTIARRLDEAFGRHKLTEIGPAEIRSWLNEIVATYSRQYASDLRGLLKAILDQATVNGLISSNPVVSVKLPGSKSRKRATPIPLDAISDIANEVGERHRALVLAGTGMRIDEAAAIQVTDLDFAAGTLSISRTSAKDERGAEVVKLGGKTDAATRNLTLPSWLVAELREHLVRTGICDGLVFSGPKGGLPSPKNWRRRVWVPAVTRLGRPEWRIHQLRHAHASLLIEAGRPITEITAMLGHTGPEVTMSVYSHMLANDDQGSADATPDFGEATG